MSSRLPAIGSSSQENLEQDTPRDVGLVTDTSETREDLFKLDQATLEPEAAVETERGYPESEGLEESFVTLMDAQPEETSAGEAGLDQSENPEDERTISREPVEVPETEATADEELETISDAEDELKDVVDAAGQAAPGVVSLDDAERTDIHEIDSGRVEQVVEDTQPMVEEDQDLSGSEQVDESLGFLGEMDQPEDKLDGIFGSEVVDEDIFLGEELDIGGELSPENRFVGLDSFTDILDGPPGADESASMDGVGIDVPGRDQGDLADAIPGIPDSVVARQEETASLNQGDQGDQDHFGGATSGTPEPKDYTIPDEPSSDQWSYAESMTDNMDSGDNQEITRKEIYDDGEGITVIETIHKNGITTQTVTYTNKKTGETVTETSQSGATTPMPDSGQELPDYTTDIPIPAGLSSSPLGSIGADSAMQPTGEGDDWDERKDQPPPVRMEDALTARVTPYGQWTEDYVPPAVAHQGSPTLEVEGEMVDPPKPDDGGESELDDQEN